MARLELPTPSPEHRSGDEGERHQRPEKPRDGAVGRADGCEPAEDGTHERDPPGRQEELTRRWLGTSWYGERIDLALPRVHTAHSARSPSGRRVTAADGGGSTALLSRQHWFRPATICKPRPDSSM